MSISEIRGVGSETVDVVPLVTFRQEGVDDNGRAFGRFTGSGETPLFAEHIRSHGIDLPPNLFESVVLVK